LPVNNENYLYQQIIDIIENKDRTYVEIDNPAQRLRDAFNEDELDFAVLH